jgi:hypothetical protein
MPRVRRRALQARQIDVDELDLYFLYHGQLAPDLAYLDSPEIYQALRRQLLFGSRMSRSHHHPLGCVPFWRYEPGIPDELRELPQPTRRAADPRLLLVDHPDTHAYRDAWAPVRAVEEARRQWLAEHWVGGCA